MIKQKQAGGFTWVIRKDLKNKIKQNKLQMNLWTATVLMGELHYTVS